MELISRRKRPDIKIVDYKTNHKIGNTIPVLNPKPLIITGKQQKESLQLNEGEEICSRCEGTGRQTYWKMNDLILTTIMCSKCDGKGKLDWVKNVMGNTNNGDECCSSSC